MPLNVNRSQNSLPMIKNTRFGYGRFDDSLLSTFLKSFRPIWP